MSFDPAAIDDTSFLDPACEARIVALIRERTGIVIHSHQREKLREALIAVCARFEHGSCDALARLLTGQHAGSPEQEQLIAEITVGESYFFRDARQIEFLANEWLPRTLAAKRARGDTSLRIWSAGCSSGQELYTLAILLREALPDWRDWQLHLLGTDINSRVLGHALRGRYGRWSFRTTPPLLQLRYFRQEGELLAVDPSLKEMVKFYYLNLRDDSFPSLLTETNALDLILCRNVFIYFDLEVVRRVMEKFAACLLPGGVLQLAATDPLVTVPGLAVRQQQELFYLERGDGEEPAPARRRPARGATAGGAVTTRPRGRRPAPPAAAPAAPAPSAPATPTAPAEQPPPPPGPEGELTELLRRQRFAEALPLIERRLLAEGGGGLLRLRAQCLANLGRRTEAVAVCEGCLKLDPLDREAQLLLGMVLLELDRPQEAEAALRRAVYLDPNLAEAHYQLGLMQLRGGERGAGLKRLRTALALLERGDPQAEVLLAQGMTRRRLADILGSELAIYSESA